MLDDTEQCQQNTHFIRTLLDDIINNLLGKLEKSSDVTKITTCHTSEMSTVVQLFTSDDTLISIANDIDTLITQNYRSATFVSSIDENFQKSELKVCELNKSMDCQLALLNKKMDSFSEYFNKLVNSSLQSQENISVLNKTFVQKMK